VNRDPAVDQWLDAADGPVAAMMRRARDIILGADSRVTESIKWTTPTFAFQGNIASFNPSKHLLSIMFHRGAEIPGAHPHLEATAGSSAPCASPTWSSSKRDEPTWRPQFAPGATGKRPRRAGAEPRRSLQARS
jgi:Domain of unknown function (DU1801)